MEEIRRVVVTVRYAAIQFQEDMELPARIPIKALASSLQRIFEMESPKMAATGIELWSQGRQLFEDETLLDAGVWSGNYIDIESKRCKDGAH